MEIKTVYQYNETMQFLGKQYPMVLCNKEYDRQLKDISAAYLEAKRFDLDSILLDAFMLGHIAGQRAERARRKDKHNER